MKKLITVLLVGITLSSCMKNRDCSYVAQKRIVFDLTTNGFAYKYVLTDGKLLTSHRNYEVGDKICF